MKKYIPLIVGILVVIVGITAYLNMKNAQSLIALEAQAEFAVYASDQVAKIYTSTDIQEMEATDFQANLKKNGKDPVVYTYTGVLLRHIIENAGITLEDQSSIVVTAVDGYTVAYDVAKVMEEDNIYLAYLREGQPLGNKESKGSGPFMVIVSKDPFSQNWSKYAVEARVQ